MFKLEYLNTIVEFLEEARIKHGVTKEDLEHGGKVEYANANDGTDFDWNVNNRLCEFGYGTKDGKVWAFKMLLDKSGEATIYCYPNGEPKPVDIIKKQLFNSYEVKDLKCIMLNEADSKGKWDKTLDEIFN